MLNALFRALGDLFSPPLRRVVVQSLAIAAGTFIVLWLIVETALGYLPTIGWRPMNWLIDLLGGIGVMLLSWLLFPAVVTMIMGLFLERVAAAVEAAHYPGRGATRRQSFSEALRVGIRLMALSIVLNVLALPVYLLLPGLNIAVFLGLNGYLFGREYFELVALRRLDPQAAKQVRSRVAARVFIGGALIACLFAVPFVNLVAPVIATAFMVHVFASLRSPAVGDTAFESAAS